jgi:hypothetical protein
MVNLENSQVMGPLYNLDDKFEGWDHMLWKFKIESLLKAREFWNIVGGI